MNTIKKIFTLTLTFAMLLSLAACGGDMPGETTVIATASQAPTEEAPAVDTVPETTEAAETEAGGKALVVYFSASGNTRRVAQAIAQASSADIFEITPAEAYSSDDLNWSNPDSRVCREHDDESARDVPLTATAVDGWDSYDTVFIGYPIWWGIAAWPVDNFVKANDFAGKTIIPFATSASSGMGESGALLAGMASGGDWQEGQRFSSGASDDDVQQWVSSLGLGF